MQRSLEEILSELYMSNLDIIGEGLPAGVNAARRGALENFNLLSLPGMKDERYRHTDMRKLFEGNYENYFTPVAELPMTRSQLCVDGYEIDVVNGFCREAGITRLANGIIYGSLRAALSEEEDVAARYYNSLADNEREAPTALNTAFMQDGAFVYVPPGVEADRPFVLSFVYNSPEEAQMCFSRALVVADEGAKARVVVSQSALGSARFLVDHVRETVIGEGASVDFAEITEFGSESSLVTGNYLGQQARSRFDAQQIWLGGGVTRVNAVTDLRGSDCDSTLYGIYFAGAAERVDVSMTVNHLVPDCRSYEMVKGVVSGDAVGAFTGKVFVAPDAQHTEAFQQSRNLQLSDGAKIYTEPQLEIYADDVKCSHGATVGQMDDEAIYYMRQRGISEEDARRLQLFGFINDVISRCADEGFCEHIAELARRRIGDM